MYPGLAAARPGYIFLFFLPKFLFFLSRPHPQISRNFREISDTSQHLLRLAGWPLRGLSRCNSTAVWRHRRDDGVGHCRGQCGAHGRLRKACDRQPEARTRNDAKHLWTMVQVLFFVAHSWSGGRGAVIFPKYGSFKKKAISRDTRIPLGIARVRYVTVLTVYKL